MKKYRRQTIRKYATALAMSLALALTGCGSGNGGTENSSMENSSASVITPEKPQPASGIVNLSEKVTKVDIPEKSMSSEHGNALSRSGFLMLSQIMKLAEDPNSNYLISPVSLQMALGMTVTGADTGTATEKEMMAVLMPGTEERPEDLNAEMAAFANRMLKAEGVSWNVVNSIWVRNDKRVELRDEYISDVTNSYAAQLFSAPFDQDTLNAINSWVKENTRERIPKILDKLDENAALVLVNAMALDGEWEKEYEEDRIHDGSFTNADGSKTAISLLWSKEDNAILLEGGVGLIRPYKGGEYSFVAILPPEGMSTEVYLSKIADGSTAFSEAFLHPDTGQGVNAAVPEFKVEYGTSMDKTLQALGMKEAYTDDAHFRTMLTENSAEVKIGTVAHKTMIQVDRTGTVAAAATGVEMVMKSAAMAEPPYQVILDRPFIYGIVDNVTGVPVFLGVQNTMEGAVVTEYRNEN